MKLNSFFAVAVLTLLAGCASNVKQEAVLSPTSPNTGAPAAAPRASIQTSLGDGAGIAALLNKNYNENTSSCTQYGTGEAVGYYWCTGVLVRTTDDGPFNPWESSPSALTLKGTSYSWIRHDLNTSTLYKPAGYVLLNQADIDAGAVPGLSYANGAVQCVYPLDAWTQRTMDRNQAGCDFEGTGLGWVVRGWGSCESRLEYTTSSQWNAHFTSQGQVNYKQCSWEADNQRSWSNMIASHNVFAASSAYNEVILANWGGTPDVVPANEKYRLWTVAYFYDPSKPGGRAIAQSFQRKMAATGKRVAILQLNFTAPSAQRFQFQQADQVAGLYP